MFLKILIVICATVVGFCSMPEQPLHVNADEVTWNAKTNELWLKGNVVVYQVFDDGTKRQLKCGSLYYNRLADKITAYGNVELIEADGNIYMADRLTLDSKFDTGILEGMRILTTDASRTNAKIAKRKDGNDTILEDVDYSPCKLCKNGNVTWRLEAATVEHDQEERLLKYRQVFLVFKGVKIFYMPYFSHPDPKVKQKSGFLMPSLGYSKDLGFAISTPYLLAAKNQDLTITPMIMSKKNPLLATEYRMRFYDGEISFGGSYTRNHSTKKQFDKIPSKDRWHVFGTMQYHMTDRNRLSVDLNRASDTTYISKFKLNKQHSTFSRQKNLTSTVNFEHFGDKAYATIKTQSFQTDTPQTTPLVLPYARYRFQTSPFSNGSHLVWDSSVLSIFRKAPVLTQTGKQVFRLSSGASWIMPYTTSNGHILKTTLSSRGDAYMSQHYNPDSQSLSDSSKQKKYDRRVESRFFPQASVDWRYPLLANFQQLNWVVEPRGLVAVAPPNLNRRRMPNEDSKIFSLDDTSIFLPNRFDGIDMVDEGQRGVLGVDNHMRWGHQQRVSLFLGQSYRFDKKSVVGSEQGEGRVTSDYITRLLYQINDWWAVFNRSALTRNTLRLRFNEWGGSIGKPLLRLDASCVYAKKGLNNSNTDVSQANYQLSSAFYENWKVSVAQIRNLDDFQKKDALASFVGVSYEDDCFSAKFSVYKSNYSDRDIKPDTGFLLQFSLKNLGSFTPISAPTYPGSLLTNLR
ncbi:MAG: LPS assembly protein LptD [Proteobacteria bacterium]|nr:LPS assembly protein LptD [Pseudomonadota bacterium]